MKTQPAIVGWTEFINSDTVKVYVLYHLYFYDSQCVTQKAYMHF